MVLRNAQRIRGSLPNRTLVRRLGRTRPAEPRHYCELVAGQPVRDQRGLCRETRRINLRYLMLLGRLLASYTNDPRETSRTRLLRAYRTRHFQNLNKIPQKQQREGYPDRVHRPHQITRGLQVHPNCVSLQVEVVKVWAGPQDWYRKIVKW